MVWFFISLIFSTILSEISLILMGVFRATRVIQISTHQNFQECT